MAIARVVAPTTDGNAPQERRTVAPGSTGRGTPGASVRRRPMRPTLAPRRAHNGPSPANNRHISTSTQQLRLTLPKRGTYTCRMTSRRWSAVGVWLASAALAIPVFVHAQAQPRVVYASALDEKGLPVTGLGPSDFVVREDKMAREVLKVSQADDPMQIALLVDNSQAADPFVRDIREATSTFIRTIGADPSGAKHQVAVITIGERPTINTDYTTDLAKAAQGANRIFAMPASGAYLLDGIIETTRGIKKRESPRPVIVAVITAGVDLSDRPYQMALEPLRASGAALHVVTVGRPVTGDQDRVMLLDRGTSETGGRYETVLTGSGLTPRLKQVAEELTHQYEVTYAHPDTLIPPDRVTVSSAKSGVTIRGILSAAPPEGGRR